MDSTDLRIVLVGKTGAGKSSTGNTILGRNAFPVSSRAQCKEETVKIYGKTLTVVDTPGLFDTTLTEEQVKAEIIKCTCFAAPLVFLVVIHAGRFTKEQQKAVKIFQQMFGEKAACYTMVLFTRGDDLEADKANINNIISTNPALSDFIRQCGGEYHVFNNRSGDRAQVGELLQKIDIMLSKKERTSCADEICTETGREKNRREDMKRPQSKNPAMVLEEADGWAQGENSAAVSRAGAGKAEEEELRIVLVGKTGVGKTSAGNTILGHKAFQSNPSATTECQKEIGQFKGQTLAVIDTPGLLNSRLTEEQVMRELNKCISLADPGPHVILIVLQGGRFIEEDQEIVKNIETRLGKEAAKFTMVLFTCGDDLKADGDTIEDIIIRDEALSRFIDRCNQVYHVLENRDKDPSQVKELLKTINEIVQKNKGEYYTTAMFRKAGRAISKDMRQSSMNQEHRSQAPRNPFDQIKTDKVEQKVNSANCSIL